MKWYVVRRVLVACVVFGLVHVLVDRTFGSRFSMWIIQAGEAAGMEVARLSGFIMTRSGGPFLGDGLTTAAWNKVHWHGPWVATALIAYGSAMSAYWVCAGPLGRTRLFGYRGVTRCGACGYEVGATTCPECGRNFIGLNA